MADSNMELCGVCCKGSCPIRKRFCESIVCACSTPFFSHTVVENNLPTNRRCRIGIPWAFMEDYGFDLPDKIATLQEIEDTKEHRVKIGGNFYVGYWFEWKDFAQSHDIGIGQVVVFSLVERSRFLVQIYKPGNASSSATVPQTLANVEAALPQRVSPPVIPNVEEDDDIEVRVAQDWLAARASRMNAAIPVIHPSKVKVKVEKVLSETPSEPATRRPGVTVYERQKCGNIPNDLEGMDVSDGIAEASDSSRQKKKFDSDSFHEGLSLRGSTRRVLRFQHSEVDTPTEDQGGLGGEGGEGGEGSSTRESSSNSEENGNSNASSASTSDSAWSPGRFLSHRAVYSNSNTEDEDEDEDDEGGDDGVEDNPEVLNDIAGKKQRSSADGSNSLDGIKRKRGRASMKTTKTHTSLAGAADEEMNETRADLLVEGHIIKRHGHGWHEPGTKRGRTYVSKRRPVTEAEKAKTLERAQKVQLNHPSFSKQLHKDSCYRSVILFPPTQFYRDHMINATKGSYKATLMDEEGKSWPTNIRGMRIFWKHFTLDHYLEEDDIVVFELVDPRPRSVTFLVHIFRVVDVKVTLTGKAGWAAHYNVVEGTKKQYFEEKRRLAKAQGLKKMQKQKQNKKRKRKDGSSNPHIDTETPESVRGKKKQPSLITQVYKRASTSQGKSRDLQKEKHAPDSPIADQLEDQHRSPWKRPTTRNRSREMNQSFGELNPTPTPTLTPSKSVASIKQEMEDAPPLETVGTSVGNAVNRKPSFLELVFGREDSD